MSNIVRFLLMFSAFMVFLACDKAQGPALNISNDIYISVLDESGGDLLDPNNPATVDLKQVKVYYDLNGVKTEINRSNLDFPQMFLVEEPGENSDHHRILLFLNTEDNSDITTTYFEWGPSQTDVFKSLINRDGNGINDEKIWLNDELICDVAVKPGRCSVTVTMDE
ncbi:MAG: hypothetical protein WBN11_05350 [Eudoraea sp.]|uniref:hypothetical protein n=1 Tax=Eudoraea sp. TaxID=1979955 RepID=UPI003C75329B